MVLLCPLAAYQRQCQRNLCLHSVRPTHNECPVMTTLWRRGSSNAGALENAEYPFITIDPQSTLAQSVGFYRASFCMRRFLSGDHRPEVFIRLPSVYGVKCLNIPLLRRKKSVKDYIWTPETLVFIWYVLCAKSFFN